MSVCGLIPLTWIHIHWHTKAVFLFYFPSFVFHRPQVFFFLCSCVSEEHGGERSRGRRGQLTKEPRHYHSRNRPLRLPPPPECSLTTGQRASPNSQRVLMQTTGQLVVPGLKPTACKLNPFGIQSTLPRFFFSLSLSGFASQLRPGNDPAVRQHLALPLLIAGKGPI